MDDRQIKVEPYRFGYQGQYAEKDSLANWNAFQLRMYEPRFGRWLTVDPYGQFDSPYIAMGNNPVSGTDPDGGVCCGTTVINGVEYALLNEVEIYATRLALNSIGSAIINGGAQALVNAASRHSGGLSLEYNIHYSGDLQYNKVYTPQFINDHDVEFDDFVQNKLDNEHSPDEVMPLATGAAEPFYLGTPLNAAVETGANLSEGNFLAAGIAAIGFIPGGKAITSLRKLAVRQAWKQEVSLVSRTGRGTTRWSALQKAQLLSTRRVSGYIGHHINSVKAFPNLAGNPNNIKFVQYRFHLRIHGGNWKNATTGRLVKR